MMGGPLLRELGLERPLVSLHEHNERARSGELVARLRAG
jgi:16S rRNA (cytidine1402-2'-O)-methyltransferase